MHQCNAIIEDLTENISLHDQFTAFVRAGDIHVIFLTPKTSCPGIYSETWELSPKDSLP